jgi:uncharacterized protein
VRFSEQVFSFECAGESLLGIASVPDQAKCTGVLIIVGGPQYRVGSHRQFLLLSRSLASAGYPVMRFDYRGMGDSAGEPRDFERIDDDIAVAINRFIARCPEVENVVLWGLCDAASASLLYLDRRRDDRVGGLCLLNPWVRSEVSLAKTHLKHYYGQRLFQIDFWKKLFTGKTDVFGAVSGLVSNWRMTRHDASAKGHTTENLAFQHRMAAALRGFKGRAMFILSGNDYTAKEFLQFTTDDPSWSGVFNNPLFACVTLPDADHTFSSAVWRAEVAKTTLDWLEEIDLAHNKVLTVVAKPGSDSR